MLGHLTTHRLFLERNMPLLDSNNRKENIWMHWVIFALAIALIAISSFMLDGKKRNSSASCTAGNEDGCAALGDCEVEALGVEDAVTTKQLTIAGLVFVVVFTIVFMIPFDESELSGTCVAVQKRTEWEVCRNRTSGCLLVQTFSVAHQGCVATDCDVR